MERFQESQSEATLKLIELETKNHALEDCMSALKLNENIPVMELLKIVRKLSKKQFKCVFKKEKLARYLHAQRQHQPLGGAG